MGVGAGYLETVVPADSLGYVGAGVMKEVGKVCVLNEVGKEFRGLRKVNGLLSGGNCSGVCAVVEWK